MRLPALLVLALLMTGCASKATTATPIAHEVGFDVIPLDEEAPYVHVIEANASTNITLHIGGVTSAGDIPLGADQGVKTATLDGNIIRIELESRESQSPNGKFTPIWVLVLHGVPAGKYTMKIALSKATCTSVTSCTPGKALEASTRLDLKG